MNNLTKSLIVAFVLASVSSFAQTPGLIYEPATGGGAAVLDPNGDGYTSATNAGFTGDDQTNSEIPYTSLVFPETEPSTDLGPGPDCSFTDFVDQGDEDPVQSYVGGGNWLFRMRMGNTAPNAKSYSILIDTDLKYGATGPNADPTYTASNPGFEIEIVFASKFGVYVYNVDPLNCTPIVSYPGTTNYQKSIALTTNCGDADYFYDFYVTFADITAVIPGFTAATPVRMAIVDNMAADASVLCNPNSVSDIAGIDDRLCGSLWTCLDKIINNYPPCVPGSVCLDRSLCPTITGPISNGATSVTGTSTEANGTTITVFKNGSQIGTTTVSGGNWTLSSISPALSSGDVITASATASGKSESIRNCDETTVAVTCSAALPNATECNASKGISGTGAISGAQIKLYQGLSATPLTPTSGNLFSAGTITVDGSGNWLWRCVGAGQTTSCTSGGGPCLSDGAHRVTITESGKCESEAVWICVGGAATTATPAITTSPILTTTTSVSGTSVANASVILYADGVQIGTTTATAGGAWTISSLTFTSGQVITAKAFGSSLCLSAASASVTVGRVSENPTLLGNYCTATTIIPPDSIYGTSSEAIGTVIKVYVNGVALLTTTTVRANGTWGLTSGFTLSPTDNIKATATVTGGIESGFSNIKTVGTKTTNAVAITTNPITEGDVSVSGTGVNGDVITLYIDNTQIGSTTIVAGGTWTIGALNSYDLYTGGDVTATATTGANCASDPSAAITVVCITPSDALTVDPNDTTICSGSAAANIRVFNSQNLVVYQLYNGASTTGASVLGTGGTIKLTSAVLTSSTTLAVKAIKIGAGTCTSTLTDSVDITVNTRPSSSVLTGTATICEGFSTNLVATITGGTSPYSITIDNGVGTTANYTSGSNISISPTSNTTYSITSVIDDNGCASTGISGTPTVTVNASPAAPTGNAAQTFCNAATIADLTATGTSIQWYDASSNGNLLASNTALANGTTYYATQTVSGCESPTRFAVTVTINATATPTGAATQVFCSATNPTIADLSATGTAIQWYDAASNGNLLASNTALVNGTSYYATQTLNSCESSSRLVVAVTINTNPAAPTGSAAQTICNSGTIADLSATGTSIQWYDASSNGNLLASNTVLVDGSTYYASQTTNACESSNRFAVTVTINIPAAPTGNATQTFCSGANPTVADLNATGTTIQWYDASSNGNLLASNTALVDATNYYASQTVNGCESTNRFAVAVTITASPIAPTGAATQTFCSADYKTLNDLSVTGTAIQWYDAASNGNVLNATDTLTDATTYYASQTISGCESPLLAIAVTVNTTPNVPTGLSTQQFCSSTNPTVANLSATGTAVQWYDSATGGNLLNSTDALVDSTTYYAIASSNGCTSASLSVLATVDATIPAPTGAAAQAFCSANNPTVADLTAAGSSIQWYDAASNGNLLASNTVLVNGTNYYASQSALGCESSTRLLVTATINTTPIAPTGNATQTFCSAYNATVADLTATGTGIQWYDAPTNGNLLISTTSLADATNYYASQTVNGCESSTFSVAVTISATPNAPTGAVTQSFCSTNNATVADLTVTGTAVQWYDAATNGNVVPSNTALTDGIIYYASQAVSGCESTSLLVVTVNITTNNTSTPTGAASQMFCATNNPTVADLIANGTNIQWYDAATNGNIIPSNTSLVNGNTYYASQTVGVCESTSLLSVVVTINSTIPSAPTGAATQSFCITSNATLADLTVTGTNIQWYDAATNGNLLPSNTALMNGSTYYASQTVGSCESSTLLAVTATINSTIPSAPTGAANQSFCASANPTLASVNVTGTNIQWYDAATGGNLLPSNTPLVDGTNYYASQTIGACESSSLLAVTVTITAAPNAPTGNATQTFCSGNNPTVADLVASGTGIQWYDAATSGNLLPGTTALANGNSYYASQTTNGCESPRMQVTVVINTTPTAPTATVKQTFCIGTNPTIANLVATGTNVQWHDASTGGNVLSSTTVLADSTTYYASQTTNSCESPRLAVLVTFINCNNTPSVNDTTITCYEDSSVTVCFSISDPDTAQTFTVSTCANPAHGSFTSTVNGNQLCITYTPAADYVGLDSLCVIICDNGASSRCDTLNVTINVIPVDDDSTIAIELFIPEGYSPNGDGVNDFFVIRGINQYPNNNIKIFNRWGNMVFEEAPYTNSWNGKSTMGIRIGGDELPAGTYFYILNLGDGSPERKGYIYLTR